MLVERGSRYSTNSPVLGSSRETRSLTSSRSKLRRSCRRPRRKARPCRRHRPFLHGFVFQIEYADGIAAVLGVPEIALVIDPSAARPRHGDLARIVADELTGLVDLADAAGGEVEEIEVVLRIDRDAVGLDALAALRVLERAEILPLAGLGIEAQDLGAVRVFTTPCRRRREKFGETKACWVASVCHSCGTDHVSNVSVFLLKRATPP